MSFASFMLQDKDRRCPLSRSLCVYFLYLLPVIISTTALADLLTMPRGGRMLWKEREKAARRSVHPQADVGLDKEKEGKEEYELPLIKLPMSACAKLEGIGTWMKR